MIQKISVLLKENETTKLYTYGLEARGAKALQSSNKSRKLLICLLEPPAEHLTVGQMIQAGKRVEEEASRKRR